MANKFHGAGVGYEERKTIPVHVFGEPDGYVHVDSVAITTGPVAPTTLEIHSTDRGALVRISLRDGTMTFGERYEPSEAARRFWSAVHSEYAEFLRWKLDRK